MFGLVKLGSGGAEIGGVEVGGLGSGGWSQGAGVKEFGGGG